jgi:hypothetical protein
VKKFEYNPIEIHRDFLPSVGHKRFPRKLKKGFRKLLFLRASVFIESPLKLVRSFKIPKSCYPSICANSTKNKLKDLPNFSI